jgi:hypothetical protein
VNVFNFLSECLAVMLGADSDDQSQISDSVGGWKRCLRPNTGKWMILCLLSCGSSMPPCHVAGLVNALFSVFKSSIHQRIIVP